MSAALAGKRHVSCVVSVVSSLRCPTTVSKLPPGARKKQKKRGKKKGGGAQGNAVKGATAYGAVTRVILLLYNSFLGQHHLLSCTSKVVQFSNGHVESQQCFGECNPLQYTYLLT